MDSAPHSSSPAGPPIVAYDRPRAASSADFISLQELVAIGRRYWLSLLGIPLAAAMLGMYLALSQKPLYQATSLVQLDPKPTQPLSRSAEIYDPGYETSGYYFTQLRIIESRKLAGHLVKRLGLQKIPEFGGSGEKAPGLLESLAEWIPALPSPPPAPELSEEELLKVATRRAQAAITAKLAPGTTLIEVQFASQDPELAASAANTLADIYIEELLQARLDVYSKATRWISDKLGDVGQDLSSAEQALQDYRESRQLINVGGNRALVEEELSENTRRLREAQRARLSLESQSAEVSRLADRPENISQAQSILLDQVVKSAAETYISTQAKVRTLESRYGDRHPQYLAAAAQLREAERNYLEQLRIRASGLAAELEIARRNEAQLRRSVQETRARMQELDRDEFELNMLERQVRSNRQLYDVFLTRFNETESNSSFSETNARIADPAVPPTRPFSPNKKLIVLVSGALGAILALATVLLRQLLHTKIELPEEVESLTSIPLLGVVPACGDALLKKSSVTYFQKKPRAPFSDAVRSIKTALLMSRDKGAEASVFAITSAEPAEGKTTLCVALGAALAGSYRVLLIDADMRRPTLARHFSKHSSTTIGLSDLLDTEEPSIEGAIVSLPDQGLSYLTAGHPTPNPALLLESKRFGALIQRIRADYDFILIDTPPVLAAGDALHLTKSIDGHLLVTRAEKTHKQAFLGMLKRLETVGARGVGVIMNGAVLKRSEYTGYYYYGSTQKY